MLRLSSSAHRRDEVFGLANPDRVDQRLSVGVRTSMRAGLIAGSIAAVAVTLISLPLHSPSDTLFNSATATIASLAVGIGAGMMWHILSSRRGRWLHFALGWGIGFGVVALATIAGEQQMERSISFGLPLAAVAFAITGVLTPWVSRTPKLRQWWLMPAMLSIAVALGVVLAGQGDQESGRLELPPRGAVADVPASAQQLTAHFS